MENYFRKYKEYLRKGQPEKANKYYEKYKKAKNEKNYEKISSSGETVPPSEIREYLIENMAEGHLSEEEESKIDTFVDKYAEMQSENKRHEQIVRKVYEGKVL